MKLMRGKFPTEQGKKCRGEGKSHVVYCKDRRWLDNNDFVEVNGLRKGGEEGGGKD